ncbi:amidase [Defluviimonas sp. 20V17]|uniref:Amidase n=1 Tax=Allgaiera indica TaxID=765699 RepID=A0AAN4UPF0_9RHOB|nr:DUF4169 family protein [Allgaiera indica]KDB04573.1 amidase [Defluviimonas sp. 20V17]GHD99647.1 amidase [Allgaiera indica]SDW21217.1 protein of unknown function [Allgaiera indica]
MAEPVNLNKARKARARAEKRAQADGNAVKFGRTKAEKKIDKARAEKARATLDAHKRATTEDGA